MLFGHKDFTLFLLKVTLVFNLIPGWFNLAKSDPQKDVENKYFGILQYLYRKLQIFPCKDPAKC